MHSLRNHAFVAILGLLAGVACTAAGPTGDDLILPPVGEKADWFGNQVNDLGELDMDGEVRGELQRHFQFDGYTFRARAGAAVTLEITQLGSSRGLDTGLFLYGPLRNGDQTPELLARDDESGYWQLSKIATELPEDGSYLAVVGAADATAEGRYRLTLTCGSEGGCLPEVVVPAECPGDVVDNVGDCMFDYNVDTEYAHTLHEQMTVCSTDDSLRDQFDWSCSRHDRPAWCEAGADRFVAEVAPDCRRALAERFPNDVEADLRTGRLALSAEIETVVSEASEAHCGFDEVGGCDLSVWAATYDATPEPVEMRELLARVRRGLDPGPGAYELTLGDGNMNARLTHRDMQTVPALADTLVGGSDPEIGRVNGDWAANWAEHSATAWVLLYREQRTYLVIYVHSAWEA